MRLPAKLTAAAIACLFVPVAVAQTPARAPATAGPWAVVPRLSTLCHQNTGDAVDPLYAQLEAAKEAVRVDREKQEAINTRIEEEFRNIDPMEKAQRMQQWMMSNPEAAMAMMQGQQAAAAQMSADLEAAVRVNEVKEASWNALVKSYGDARIAAYASLEPRRKTLLTKLGGEYSTARADLLSPSVRFFQDPSTSQQDWAEGESITAAYDQAYKTLCPAWWGSNGRFQTYLKQEKDRLIAERIPELEKMDAPKLQQYAIMNTPAATYRSTAEFTAVDEYLDLILKVYNERDVMDLCATPRTCDGAYP